MNGRSGSLPDYNKMRMIELDERWKAKPLTSSSLYSLFFPHAPNIVTKIKKT